jgi:hypothetical protein
LKTARTRRSSSSRSQCSSLIPGPARKFPSGSSIQLRPLSTGSANGAKA